MKHSFLFTILLLAIPGFVVAQQRPYISLDVNFANELQSFPARYNWMGKLPDNSFVMMRTEATPGLGGVWAYLDSSLLVRVSAEGTVQWEINLGQFMPLKVFPGPDSNITVMGYSLQDVSVTSGWPQVYSTYFGKVIDTQGNVVQTTAAMPVINSSNCDILINSFYRTADPKGLGAVALSDGNFVVRHTLYDTTKTASHDRSQFMVSKISPLGQKIWSKPMPYYSDATFCGLALSGNGNIVYSGVNFKDANVWEYDNASFVLNNAGNVLGSSQFTKTFTGGPPASPFNATREGFAPASNSGFWSWLSYNAVAPNDDYFPIVYQSETCDTLFGGLVPFMGEDASWSNKPMRTIGWGTPTPNDNGFLLMVNEGDFITGRNDHYLLKLRSDGSVHWRSDPGGMSPNFGQNGYFTSDSSLIQLDLSYMRLTRWHIPKGTATDAAPAASSLQLAPNPAREQLTVSLAQGQAGAYPLRIADLLGKVVYTTEVQAIAGQNQWQIPVGGLAPGMYVLSVGEATQAVFVKE